MRIPRPVRVASLVALPAALLISCSSVDGAEPGGVTDSPTAAAAPTAADEAPPVDAATVVPTPGPEKVRDAFAGLQATLDDSCTTEGNCAYVLGRVYDELEGLDAAMKADPKGPGHFPEPIAWIAELHRTIGADRSYPNLKKHKAELLGTRDRINVWMQDHPDDYR
ncbi:hypothetical protein [Streptomyces sp. NPDC001970]